MKGKLTPKQERFCLEYFKTGNASEAYRIAYDCQNMKPDVIWVKASELLASGNVSVRIEQLQAKAEAKAILTKERGLKILADIADAAPKESDRVSALKVAGKWNGWEAPAKTHQTINTVSPFERYLAEKEGSALNGD